MELVAVSAGGISIYSYGVVVLGAVVLGLLAAWVNIRVHGLDFWRVEDMLLWGLPLALVGGRIAYIVRYWMEFSVAPLSLFCFWQGGFSLYGGVLAFLLVVFAYSEIHGFDAWRWLDLLMPSIALAASVHGLGLYSLQFEGVMPIFSGSSFAEYVDVIYRPLDLQEEEYFHFSAMCRACLQMLIFLGVGSWGLLQRQRRVPWASGCIFLLGAGLMALVYFFCSFFGPAQVILDEAASFERWFSVGAAVLCGLLFRYRFCREAPVF